MAAGRQGLNPTTNSVGFTAKLITVSSISADGKTAVCVDRLSTQTNVSMLVQRSKGPLPAVGESWLLTQDLGIWTFAAFVASSPLQFSLPAGSSSIAVQGSPPAGASTGALWMNTSGGNQILEWSGLTWNPLPFGTAALADKSVTAAKIADGTITSQQIAPNAGITAGQVAFTASQIGGTQVLKGTSQPVGAAVGALWLNPANGNQISEWDGNNWNPVLLGGPAIQPGSITAQQIASAAGITAGQVNFTYRDLGGLASTISSSQPASPAVNDLWYDANNGYVLKQWNGTAWAPYQWGTNVIAAGSVTAQLIAAGAVTAQQIAAGTITADLIAAGAIDGQTIVGAVIEGGTIEASDIILDAGANNAILGYSTTLAGSVTLLSSGSWTCPPGISFITVEVWSGSGGGGGTDSTGTHWSGGGGGGGGYSRRLLVPVTPGHTYTFTVGHGGNGGSPGNSGTAGGTSTITLDSSVTVSSTGGAGGVHGTSTGAGAGGAAGTGATASGGAGAAGGQGNGYVWGGGGGSSGDENGNGSSPSPGFPWIAPTSSDPDSGNGGNGGFYQNSSNKGAPQAGVAPGGGGGGGCIQDGTSGKAGAAGQIRLTWPAAVTPNLSVSTAGVAGTDSYSNPYKEGNTVYSGNAYIQMHVNQAGPYPALELASGLGSELDHPAMYTQPLNAGAVNESEQLSLLGPGSTFDGRQPSVSLVSSAKDGSSIGGVIIGTGAASGYPVISQTDGTLNTASTNSVVGLTKQWTVPAKDPQVNTVYRITAFGDLTMPATSLQAFTWEIGVQNGVSVQVLGSAAIAASALAASQTYEWFITAIVQFSAVGASAQARGWLSGTLSQFGTNLTGSNSNPLTGAAGALGSAINTAANATFLQLDGFWAAASSGERVRCFGSMWERLGN